MPFDRLIGAVDDWAAKSRRHDVFAQVGEGGAEPAHLAYRQLLTPDEFEEKVAAADLLIAHAGMGSILTALRAGKPILVMPRLGDLRETRNDHQVATARRLGAMGKVAVAMDTEELLAKLDRLDELTAAEAIGRYASAELLEEVGRFVRGDRPRDCGRHRGRNGEDDA